MNDPRQAVESLLAHAGDRDKNVRTQVSYQLGQMADPAAREAVYEATHSDEWRRRFVALRAMRQWPDDERRSAAALRAALADPVPSVRWAAVRTVSDPERVVEVLGQIALNDPEATVPTATGPLVSR